MNVTSSDFCCVLDFYVETELCVFSFSSIKPSVTLFRSVIKQLISFSSLCDYCFFFIVVVVNLGNPVGQLKHFGMKPQ